MWLPLLLAACGSFGPAADASGAPPALAGHPNSVSASGLQVRGASIRLTVECQVLSLAEVVDGFASPTESRATPAEIADYADEIAGYVGEHYRIRLPDGRLLEPRTIAVTEAPARPGYYGDLEQHVAVELELSAPEPPTEFLVEVDLFADTSPLHQDLTLVTWNGIELAPLTFGPGASERIAVATAEALERGRPALARYFEGGVRRWTRLADVALLLLALLVAAPTPARGLAVAGVAVASAVSALAVCTNTELVVEHARFLALAVPLAAAYLGAEDLLARARRSRGVEALAFGAAVGAREAALLRPELALELGPWHGTAGHGLALVAGSVAVTLTCAAWLVVCSSARTRIRIVVDGFALAVGLVFFAMIVRG